MKILELFTKEKEERDVIGLGGMDRLSIHWAQLRPAQILRTTLAFYVCKCSATKYSCQLSNVYVWRKGV